MSAVALKHAHMIIIFQTIQDLILTQIYGEVFSSQSVVRRKGHIYTDR